MMEQPPGCTFAQYFIPNFPVDAFAATSICSVFGYQLAQISDTDSANLVSLFSICGVTSGYFGNLDGYAGACNIIDSNFDATFFIDTNTCTNFINIVCASSTNIPFIPASTQYTGLSYTLPTTTITSTSVTTSTYTGPLTVSISGEPVATIPLSLVTNTNLLFLTSTTILGTVAASSTVTVTTTVLSFLNTSTVTSTVPTSTSETLSPTNVFVIYTTTTFLTVTATLTQNISLTVVGSNTLTTTMTFTSTSCIAQSLTTLTIGINSTLTTTTTTTLVVPVYQL